MMPYYYYEDRRPFARAIESAWKRPYIGGNAIAFVESLNDTERSPTVRYSNSMFLVQSSGSGKSRMLHETAGLIFTIPANLRDPGESEYLAYPHPDSLLELLRKGTPTEYYGYLEALFFSVRQKVQALLDVTTIQTYEDLVIKWRQHLDEDGCKHRDSLYRDVMSRLYNRYWRDETTDNLKEDVLSALQHLLAILTALPYSSVSSDPSSESKRVKLLLYYDEAHELCLTKTREYRPSPIREMYPDFLTCLNHLLRCSTQVVAVFASVFSQIDPALMHEYIFRDGHPRVLHAPFNETPFDISPMLETFYREPQTLETSSTVKYLVQFGRPLWWTMLEGWDSLSMEDQLIDLARGKLLGELSGTDDDRGHEKFFSEQIAAVIDVLVSIEYEPNDETLAFQLHQVARHMRLIYSISKSRSSVISGYSSEPIVAEGAANQLYHWVTCNKDPSIVSKLLTASLTNKIPIQQPWEFTAVKVHHRWRDGVLVRLLIMVAYVLAIGHTPEHRYLAYHSKPVFCRGVSLISFVEHLFPKDIASHILDSTPINIGSDQPFREAFKNSAVRFTHFVRAGDGYAETVFAMQEACLRGMGYVCLSEDSAVDMMIPILLDQSQPITVENMSAIMWRIMRPKNRYRFLDDTLHLRLFPRNAGTSDAPFISITSDLGTWSKSSLARDDIEQVPQIEDSSHPHYKIFIHGCSPNTFNVVGQDETDTLEKFLKLDVDPTYVPSQDDKTKAGSYQKDPRLLYRDSFSWFNNGSPKQRPEEAVDHFVSVGAAARLHC